MGIANLVFVNDSPPQCDDLFLNSVRSEVNNIISNTGQTPTTSSFNQLGIATAIMAAGSTFYTDSGIADAYVLAPVGSKSAPNTYFNGMQVRFYVGNTNTGACTINVNSLGVKNIKASDGTSDPASGDFVAGQEISLTFNGTNFVVPGGVAPATVTFPVGGMIDFAGTLAPSGWLLCYGQAISRTTYASLFGVLGTAWGIGNGSSTFNLPDTRGRTFIGLDNLGGVAANRITDSNADSLNNTGGGSETTTSAGSISSTGSTTLSIAQIPAHNHSGTFYRPDSLGNSGPAYASGSTVTQSLPSQGGGASHNHSGGTFTGSAALSTQPWIGSTKIIKY